jgi:hypothetical protein
MVPAWPAWHSDNPLKADHLLGLEDYLLARAQIIDEGAWGVDAIADWEESIRLDWIDPPDGEPAIARRVIRVTSLRGVTRGGHPIVLDESRGNLEREIHDEVVAEQNFDLAINVNSREAGTPKLTLLLSVPEDGVEGIAEDFHEPQCLYLGRYRISIENQDTLVVVYLPRARRFSGFGPVSGKLWQGWVAPLTERIGNLLAAGGASSSPANTELLRLSYEWSYLPLPALARRLRMVRWLNEWQKTPGTPPEADAGMQEFEALVAGDLLPEKLAGLLPDQMARSAPAPGAPSGISQSFPVLLEAMAQFTVRFHAPIGLLRQWAEDLGRSRTAVVSEPDRSAIADAAARSLDRGEWSKAVACITCACLGLKIPGGDAIEGSVRGLAGLYSKAREAAAGPMAFYWLAKGAAEVQPIVVASSGPVSAWFARLGGGRAPVSPPDSVQRFLNRPAGRVIAATEIRPFSWRENTAYVNQRGTATIVVAGANGSGKSDLINGLLSTGGVSERVSDARPGNVFGGRIAMGDRGVQVSLSEIDTSRLRGAKASMESAWSTVAQADLLILVVEPREIDEFNPDLLLDLANRLRPRAPVAIAYTKADEYGVAGPRAMRFVNGPAQSQVFSRWRSSHDERDWSSFVKGGEQRNRLELDNDEYVLTRGKTQSLGSSTETRKYILESSAQLWKDSTVGGSEGFLNGYLVAAASRDDYLVPLPHRGILQLVADFLGRDAGGKPA